MQAGMEVKAAPKCGAGSEGGAMLLLAPASRAHGAPETRPVRAVFGPPGWTAGNLPDPSPARQPPCSRNPGKSRLSEAL